MLLGGLRKLETARSRLSLTLGLEARGSDPLLAYRVVVGFYNALAPRNYIFYRDHVTRVIRHFYQLVRECE